MPSSNIAIIGAGIAGITAARTLKAAGHSVQVFEKSRGSGGRLASKRSEMGRINLGTQAFSNDDPLFLEELHAWQQVGWVQQHHSAGQTYWTGVPYMSALTRQLLGDLNTDFSCHIQRLSHDSRGWLLHEQNDRAHGPFQQLIIAIPAPQASALLNSCAPELAHQADSVKVQPVWMVALGFKQPLTHNTNIKCPSNQAIADITVTPLSAEHPMQTWMLRARADWSSKHLENQHDDVIDALRSAFSDLLDSPLPLHDSAFAHRWRYALGALKQPTTALYEQQRGLYVAGDWCGSGDVYSAWHSGKNAAQQLLDHLHCTTIAHL